MKFNFDPPETWALGSQYTIEADATAPTQPNVLKAQWAGGAAHPFDATHGVSGLAMGLDYPVTIWVNCDGVNPGDLDELNLDVTYEESGNPVWSGVISKTIAGTDPNTGIYATPSGWVQIQMEPFFGLLHVAAASGVLRFHGSNSTHVGIILVDQIEIIEAANVAVMLSEFAVRAVLNRLQAALNTEIGYVESEAAIGVDLPVVTGWRCYDPGIATPDVVECEVYEIGDHVFPSERYDQSTWQAGQRTRVLSKVPLRAAINHANRGNADAADATLLASQMTERSRFYGAALVRTLRNDPTCGQATAVTVVPRAVRYNVRAAARITEDIRRGGRVEFDFDVYLQESPTNETQAAGASLPSATLEAP